jgi:preflagellin peptidase FlaK
MQVLFDLARTAIALLFLSFASWSDYRTREVSDNVWMLFAPLSLALTFSEIYLYEFPQLPFYGLCFALTAIFAIVIFYSGGFGGADAKALMCLALILPFYPANLLAPLSGTVSPISQILFPLTIFSNSVLMAALLAIVLLLYNVFSRLQSGIELFGGKYENESLGRKILVMITGYRVSIRKLKDKWHIYPLEDITKSSDKQPERKLLVVPKDEGRDAIVQRLQNAVNAGTIEDGVWATPGLPFLVFLTSGLLIALLLGDIVWILLRLFLG